MKFNNPIDPGCYADPEARFYEGKYYIYVTRSLPFKDQMNQDCFVSEDLVNFEKVTDIIDMSGFDYITNAVWAPTIIEKDGMYYYVFASNNIQSDAQLGGIEIARSEKPEGPFKAYLGKPLIDHFINGAQPIDAHLFKDDDGSIYMYFGGWGHCNVCKMNETMDGFEPLPNGELFMEVTPDDYVEGPCMLKRNGTYYFMWSGGCWTADDYHVAYCKADSPFGPFKTAKTILKAQPPLADGPGHHGFLQIPGKDEWLIVYHRRVVGDKNGNHRYLCIDELHFDEQGNIIPVVMT